MSTEIKKVTSVIMVFPENHSENEVLCKLIYASFFNVDFLLK